METENSRLIGIDEASKMLGVTKQTLRNWDARDILKAVRTPSNRRKYRIEDIEKIINA